MHLLRGLSAWWAERKGLFALWALPFAILRVFYFPRIIKGMLKLQVINAPMRVYEMCGALILFRSVITKLRWKVMCKRIIPLKDILRGRNPKTIT